MVEFDVKKLVRLAIIAFAIIFLLRACTASTTGHGYGGGGGGFFTGIFLGQMLGGDRGGRGRVDRNDKNVRRGSTQKSRSGGFGFGK